MGYSEADLKIIRWKRPDLKIQRPEKYSLDQIIIEFLKKYEVYVKPVTTQTRNVGQIEGINPVARARETMATLEKKHLIEKAREQRAKGDGGGQAKKLYKPTKAAIDLYGKANV